MINPKSTFTAPNLEALIKTRKKSMNQIKALFLLAIFSSSTLAGTANYYVWWESQTLRKDGTTVTGVVTYQVFAGEEGGELTPRGQTMELGLTGTITTIGDSSEWYLVACEDGKCNEAGEHTIAVCGPALIGVPSLNVTIDCIE